MEALLKRELGTSLLKSTGHSGGGCISEGQSFDTDTGRVFVKINHKNEVIACTLELNALLYLSDQKYSKTVIL
uniref:Uncharacterized protein n=1 Tax=Sinocyclocheilus grahami TaxID=75366 RepID=A0A672K6D9_SINGR